MSVIGGRVTVQTLQEDFGVMFINESIERETGSVCWRPKSSEPTDIHFETESGGTGQIELDKASRAWCSQAPGELDIMISLFEGYDKQYWESVSLDDTQETFPDNFVLDDLLLSPGGLPAVLPAIAESLTYHNLNLDQDGPHLESLTGTVWTQKAFVAVRWAWLALPVALNTLGFLFLWATAIYTHRHNVPLWKSSLLAILYHGLEDRSFISDQQQSYDTASEMESAARTTLVSLSCPSEDGGGYMLLRS